MEFFDTIWEKIKSLFSNKAQMVDQAAIDAERARRLEELNDPDDDFANDVAYDEKELAELSRKAANRRNFRTGYYIFGSILAVGLVAWGLIGLFTTPQADISIMIQADGMVEQADAEAIRSLVADAVGDRNGDGKILVEVTSISMPITRTQENEPAFTVAREDIEEALIPPTIGLIFGRDMFIDMADDFNKLAEESVTLTQVMSGLSENNPLREYVMTYRDEKTEQSALAKEVFNVLISK